MRQAVVKACSALASGVLLVASVRECDALTKYKVRLSTAALVGEQAKLAFDFVSGGTTADTLAIQNFAHDGTMGALTGPGLATFAGGPVRGALLAGLNPAPSTLIGNDAFYNQLTVPFTALGTSIAFDVQLSEPSPAPQGIPDEMSFFYLRGDGLTTLDSSDPLGTDALFSIDLTGSAGGDLNVYAPMTFIPPDSIVLQLSNVSVPNVGRTVKRLKFLGVMPNPSNRGVRFTFEVPQPGGYLRAKVYDVAGRLMAQPVAAFRQGGTWTSSWDGNGPEGRVPAGVYLVQLEMSGQSLVRRIVVAR